MEPDNNGFNGKQKKKLLKTFLISIGVTFALCAVLVIAGIIIYNSTIASEATSQVVTELTEEEKIFEEEKKEVGELNKTIAVFGVDKDEIRTDVIFVVNFNTATNKVKVVSVPRDTKVTWTDKQKRSYSQLTGYSINVSKINEMAAYGRINQNIGNIRDFTIDELENILKVNIDSYVVINLEAFREIVDAVGGVDLYVPQRMYYVDNYQGLYIDLQEGMQHLDGDEAEQLVRFRQYPLGDAARVEVQQTFLKAFAEKVMSQSPASLAGMVTKLFPYIKTDVKLGEVLDYLDLLNQFSLEGLNFYTVPGEGADYEGPSYYYIDEIKLEEMIKDVFLDTTTLEEELAAEDEEDNEEDTLEEESNIDMTVEVAVYNAAAIKGIAGLYGDELKEAGYDVVEVGNYHETGLEETIIYAKDVHKAEQFLEYLPEAEIVRDASLEYDIEIVVGRDSAK